MKICLLTTVSDLTQGKKTLMEKINNHLIPDPKHKMYKIYPVDHILKSMKNSGMDGVELYLSKNFSDEIIAKIKKILDKHSLQVFSIHQSDNTTLNIKLQEIENLCVIAKKFLAPQVTIHINVLGEKIFSQNFVETLKKLQEKYKILFGIENTPPNPLYIKKTYIYRAQPFTSAIAKTGLNITLDTTHFGQTGDDICDFYLKNQKRIINIHLSDYKKHWLNRKLFLGNYTHLPLGKGELPIEKFLRLLKETNYQGLVTMEINADLDGLCQNTKMIKDATK